MFIGHHPGDDRIQQLLVPKSVLGAESTYSWIHCIPQWHIPVCCAVFSRSVMSDSVTPWTVACQAPLSVRILEARILEWVAMFSSRVSSQPRARTQVSHIAGRFFTISAPRKPKNTGVGRLSLLQEKFLTQESNRGLLHCRQILYQLSYQRSPYSCTNHAYFIIEFFWTLLS